jgi:uncharacterized membrane protein
MSDESAEAGLGRSVEATHVAAAFAGGALFGAGGRSRLGLFALAGLALLAAAAEPLIERRVIGAGDRRRSLALRESVEIDRPVSEVFEFFKNFENFVRIIGAVHSVVDYENGLSHWEAYTTSGELASWDAVVTKYVPNSVIAWESVAGSPVKSTGLIRFAPVSPTRTRLNFEVTYRAAPSGLGDAVRALMTPAPVVQLRADLEHARFYIESLPPRVPEPRMG